MKHGWPVFFLVPLLLSCSAPLSYRTVAVHLDEIHPWEQSARTMLWYTLVWNDADGSLRYLHLPAGTRSVDVSVPGTGTVYFCAYPLGSYFPFASALVPLDAPEVFLSQSEGNLCSTFLDHCKDYPEALGSVNYPYLYRQVQAIADTSDTVDVVRLLRDVVNGEVSGQSFVELPRQSIRIGDIPAGHWVGDRADDGTFWFLPTDAGIERSLADGLHCFLDREDGLLLKVLVDGTENQSFLSLHSAPIR